MDQRESSRGEETFQRGDQSGDHQSPPSTDAGPGLETARGHLRSDPRFAAQVRRGRPSHRIPPRKARSVANLRPEAPQRGVAREGAEGTSLMTVETELISAPPEKLVVEGVSKTFRTARADVHALDNISLNVREGDFVCLVGPSGCGKSTLLNIIAG